ncbi:MAG TPA: DUF4384 domain-containing protein [Gemmatimonadales bacterium]|jgi:hypothetical protein|nr:DUF4384 domain-containing protein [Gemmatimonadales bacterium]
MIATLLLLSALQAAAAPPQPSTPSQRSASDRDPTIKLWLSDDGRYRPGDRAKVQVQTREDGYLVVVQVDAQKRVRVLFPLNPGDDNFVRGGKKYEIVGRGGRGAFTVDARSGQGTVYAAVSTQRFDFEHYANGNQWDFRALDGVQVSNDAEADLNEFVRGISKGDFDYDLLAYGISRRSAYAYGPAYYGYGYPYAYPYAYYPAFAGGFFVNLRFGGPRRVFVRGFRPFRFR